MEVHAHMLSYVKVEMRLHMFDSCSMSLHGFTWILPHLHHAAAYRTRTCDVHVNRHDSNVPSSHLHVHVHVHVCAALTP